jgi:dinuclear metal center YbgI/SA1388 family protein
MPTVGDVTDFLGQVAPLDLAAEWDNVGLLLGEAAAPVDAIMTCLTVTPATAAEAVADGANLLITHHPILFRPTQRLTGVTAEGHMLLHLARGGVAVYSPHSAYDNCAGGINDLIAQRLGLGEVIALRSRDGPRQYKVIVFIPDQDLSKVADALFAAGAGKIGNYSQCSFRLAGTGTFLGSEAANPTVGQKGRREEVNEWRLEVVCPHALLERVLAAMRQAHSYEEPAFDVYPLWPGHQSPGLGRLGVLSKPVRMQELAQIARSALAATSIQIVGDPDLPVARVAIACGAGGEFITDAAAKKANVLLTGEARFHDYLAAEALGLGLLLPGHYATERPGIEELAHRLQRQFPDVPAWASRRESDPLRRL